jgi:hypothetical protein
MTTLSWKGDGGFLEEVVGESQYQDHLRQLSTGRRTKVSAMLICEPENSYDKNSVRVEIAGKPVGYLPRDRAKFHQERLARLNKRGVIVECPAVIVQGDARVCGVFLDMPARVTGDPASKDYQKGDDKSEDAGVASKPIAVKAKLPFVRRYFLLLSVVALVLLLSAVGTPIGLVLAAYLAYYRFSGAWNKVP